MSQNKKMVEAITPIDEDFAQWYTDICHESRAGGLFHRQGLRHSAALRLCHLGEHHADLLDARVQGHRARERSHAAVHPRKPAAKGKRPRGGLCPRGGLGDPWAAASSWRSACACAPPARRCSATIIAHVHALLAGPAHAIQPVVQRGALGKDHPPLPAHAGILVAGGPYHPRNRAGGHRGDRAACWTIYADFCENELTIPGASRAKRPTSEKFAGRGSHLYHRGHDARRQGAAERHQPLLRRRVLPRVRRAVYRDATIRCSIPSRHAGA